MYQEAFEKYLKQHGYSSMNLKAVLFDMDGVLFNSMPNHARSWHKVMELLTQLNKEGTNVVMVTHSQHDAGYATRTINLFDGSVVNEVSM